MTDDRKLYEICFALLYKRYFRHGTDGHNIKLLLAEAYADIYRIKLIDNMIYMYRNIDGKEVLKLEWGA